jgi:AAA domain/Bifunctional DNA primase/polymerase, N-terminal
MALVLSYFPLFAIDTSSAPPRCACTRPNCSAIGKHPAKKGWRHAESEIGPDGNGVKTGNGLVVVDLDVRPEKGKDGVSELLALLPLGEDIPDAQKIPDTLTVSTPTGGVHLYFEVPKDTIISNSSGLVAPGIDIRGEGGFVVAPGSPHKNGGTYVCEDENAPIAPMPTWLLEKILAVSKKPRETKAVEHQTLKEPSAGEEDTAGWGRAVSWAHTLCETAEPSVEGLNGSSRLFHVACQLMRSSLPLPKLTEIITETYNPRCSPSWSPEEIEHKLSDADGVFDEPRGLPPEGLMERICALGVPVTSINAVEATAISVASAAELLDGISWGGWDQPLEPVPYIIDGLIPAGCVGLIVAPPGSGKTWVATSMALAAASGKPWLGKFPVMQGRAVFFDYEANKAEMSRRLQKLQAGSASSFGYATPDLAINDPAFWTALAEMPLPPLLVVVDGLCAGTPGVDENAKGAELPLVLAKNLFTRRTGGSVIIIHHPSKSDPAEVRGYGGIRAACDFVYPCVAQEDPDTHALTITIGGVRTKMRQGTKPDVFTVVLTDKDGLSLVGTGEPAPSGAGGVPDSWMRARALELVRLAPAYPGGISRTELAKNIGGKKTIAFQLVKELEMDGLLIELGHKMALDDDFSRELRIINTLRSMKGMRVAKKSLLKELAHVKAFDIERLELRGVIIHDATNGYLVDDRKMAQEANGASRQKLNLVP